MESDALAVVAIELRFTLDKWEEKALRAPGPATLKEEMVNYRTKVVDYVSRKQPHRDRRLSRGPKAEFRARHHIRERYAQRHDGARSECKECLNVMVKLINHALCPRKARQGGCHRIVSISMGHRPA